MHETRHQGPTRWNPRSIAILTLAWLILQAGGLFSPGLLDDVDSIYIEIARQMLHRHDFVTPMIDGVRFFDKPPLMYWLASGSMAILGEKDWAARLPLALAVLALLLATYALGIRLFAHISPPGSPDRGALYAALALATSVGPYLYTRFYIPDIVIALWMTLAIHAFLVALERIQARATHDIVLVPHDGESEVAVVAGSVASTASGGGSQLRRSRVAPTAAAPLQSTVDGLPSALLPCLAFAAVTALNLLTKGLIGIVFPIAFVLLYLGLTRQLRLLPRFHPIASTAVFLAIAAPWHILAALRNPAIALPPGVGLPATGGWAWFYLYNEHIARFLSRRIPHDYGQVPVLLFWLLAAVWLVPWIAFVPGALKFSGRSLLSSYREGAWSGGFSGGRDGATAAIRRDRQAALALLLWAGTILIFFTFSARQEYYSLPAMPALALLAGGLLARADNPLDPFAAEARRSALRWSAWLLVPICTLAALVAAFFAVTAPHTDPNIDIAVLLKHDASDYNLSLSHLFDLTGPAMGLFRGPLVLFSLSMLAIGPVTYLLRRSARTFTANLTLAAAATALLLAVHAGLVRFYPILGSKQLANAILEQQQRQPLADDMILLDGELTTGSSLLFYCRQPAHLVDGRVNGPWYGSFWPDAPDIFETEATLRQLWSSPRRVFLLTDQPEARTRDLGVVSPVHAVATAGGKSVLSNRP